METASSAHALLSSHAVVRGLSPEDSAQVEEVVRALVGDRAQVTVEAGKGTRGSVCEVYTCDAVGRWLIEQSDVVAAVRRDAPRSFERMTREGTMSEEDWVECRRTLRDKAEGYLIATRTGW